MFDFRTFEVVHWDFLKREVIPLDGKLNTIVGPNGSGKTTLLDGMRTLLGIKCSDDRDYKRYARRNNQPTVWLRAVVTNERQGNGYYPFRPYISKEVTLVCRIRKRGGDWPREYAILEGDVPIEQIEEKAGKDWMGLRDYEIWLERAGLTRAIKHVLTLEQGATDKLSNLSPRELLRLVFDARGDQLILDNYQQAREKQMAIKTELDELQKDLEGLELKMALNQQRIDSFNRRQTLLTKQERLLLEDIPRLEILELQEQIRGGRHNRRGIMRDRRRIKGLRQERVTHLESLKEEVSASEKEFKTRDQDAKKALTAHGDAKHKLTATQDILKEKERLQSLSQKQADGVDPVALEAEKAGYQANLSDVRARINVVKSSLHVNKGTLAARRVNRTRDLPGVAIKMRESLNSEGVVHSFLSEVMEIVLEDWQPVIEGLISQEALTILIADRKHQARGWALGEAYQYRNTVTGDLASPPPARRGTLLEAVSFSGPVPAWIICRLEQLKTVESVEEGRALPETDNWITRKGYCRDRRGGRYVGITDKRTYMYGDAAVQAEIEHLEQLIRENEKELTGLEAQRNTLVTKIDDCNRLIVGWDANKGLAARLAEFAQAEADLPVQQDELRQAGIHLGEAEADKATAFTALREFSQAASATEEKIKSFDHQIEEKDRSIEAEAKRVKGWIDECREKRSKLPQESLHRAALQAIRDEVGSLAKAQLQCQDIQEQLDGQEWETDPQVISIGQKFELDHAAKHQTIRVRRENHVLALALVDEAREKYIHFLQATMRRYATNLRVLSDMAAVEVRVVHPQLTNDDMSLAQAGLEVEFRFDKKDSDETSGGQKVIKSLILLVALMMDDDQTGGFVFVDEPYAHLDVVNINLVSNFLRESKAQFVLTTPNTHNINVFEAGDITVVTRTRVAPNPWAPSITMARKDDAA